MKFKFKLQKTADFFDHKETAKKMEIARIKNHLGTLEEKFQYLEEENKRSIERDSGPQVVSISWLKLRQDRIEANLESMSRLQTEMDEVNAVLDQKLLELRKLSQKKKALEKVKEKRLAEFKLERSRSEQKRLDENYQILRHLKE